jgi:hypothetical protein
MASSSKEYFILVEKVFNHSLRELISVHRTLVEAGTARDIYDFTFYKREIYSSKSFTINDELYEAYFAEIDRLKKAKEDYEALCAELRVDEVSATAKAAHAAFNARRDLYLEKVIAGEKDIDYEAFMADVSAQRESTRNAADEVMNNPRKRELYEAMFDTKDFGKLAYDLKKPLNPSAHKCSDCGGLTYAGCACTM